MSCAGGNRAGHRAPVRHAGACLLTAALFVVGPALIGRAEPHAIRALSLAATDLISGQVPQQLTAARDSGVDTVFVPVSLHGDLPDANIDALVRDARARGLRVHAAVPIMFAAPASALPLSRDHIIYQHPEWLMVPRELALELQAIDPRSPDYLGRLVRWTRAQADRVDGLYLSPLQADAVAFVTAAVKRLAARHAFDGIHFEAVHFPDPAFDYGARALDAFRSDMQRLLDPDERMRIDAVEAIDPFGYPEELPGEWRRFRLTRLTSLIAQLRSAVRDVRPQAVISAAAVPGAATALERHLQDWQTWSDNGFVDALSGPRGPTTTLFFSYEALLDPAAAQPVSPAVASP